VKILPAQMARPERHVARFVREAQAAARLHHTNIVPVFGVGEDQGIHFYVMQFIDGQGLDAVLRDIQQASGSASQTPTSAVAQAQTNPPDSETPDLPVELSPVVARIGAAFPGHFRRVAQIGVGVANALEHAHAHGVLHRDVKPANILVDEEDSVWVTDFGLAKLLNADEITAADDIVGTLRYVAPEAFHGTVDARSDVYGLGLTLYELLALQPAFTDQERSTLMRRIMEEEPPPLGSLLSDVPRDLETIVTKAMAKEPKHRYQTAGELADDLQRYLDERPIRARHVTILERAWRWSRRNRRLAAMSAVSLVLLIAVSLLSTVGYVQLRWAYDQVDTALGHARQSTADAVTAKREAEAQRDHTQREYERAEAALQVAMESLEELFAQIEAARRPGQRLDPKEARGMLDALERMLAFHERLAEQGQGGPESQIRVAEALRRMGDLYRSLHEYDDAEAALLRAIASLEGLIEEVPDETEPHIQYARANYTLGRVYRDMGRRDEGDPLIQLAVTELEALPSDAPQRRHIQELLSRFRRDVRRVPGE
jgi:tetratricopeptide (TPR) repeat protein